MLLGIDNAFRLFCASEIAPDAVLVFRKSPLDIGRDTGIERTVFAFQEIDEIEHLLILHLFGILADRVVRRGNLPQLSNSLTSLNSCLIIFAEYSASDGRSKRKLPLKSLSFNKNGNQSTSSDHI